ncbi:MAG TPA: DUF1700 domain-containing protein [Candidatus Merdenecus merdavium]|nr:DUF1700 domain-containing protein [Candidatus Merdenecus merdavium]
MKKIEFLQKLENSIRGELPDSEVRENLRYYDQYISDSVAKGQEEEDVIDELGGPTLVAKTLIEAYNFGGSSNRSSRGEFYGEDAPYDSYGQGPEYQNQYEENQHHRKGFRVNYNGNRWDVRFGKLKLNTWYGKLIVILSVVLIITVITSIAFSILNLLLPLVFPLLIIILILNVIGGRRN